MRKTGQTFLLKGSFIWGSSQNLTIFGGSFLCILGSFLKAKVQNGGYFLGLLKFQIFFWGA